MQLGNFSVSLAVTDIQASKDFYEKLGFVEAFGKVEQKWVIMKNGSTKVGLFEGMFERNLLTFNPGWDEDGQPVADFDDIRTIQQRLKDAGVEVGADIESSAGPANFFATDPDGNPILFDQHL